MRNRKAFLFIALVLLIACAVSAHAFAASGEDLEDAMLEIEADGTLAAYKQGETVTLSSDGYIGIPVEISVYYSSDGTPKSGYDTDATPVILYVVNAGVERIGTNSDVNIIKGMLDRGYIVAVCDYMNNAKAISPDLDWSAQGLRNKLKAGEFFSDSSVIPSGTYYNSFVVPAGYDVSLNHVFWEIDKHGTDGTLDKIAEIWNNDFRGVKGNTVIKWTDGNGNRKSTQNAADGTSPVWLNADGSENENGEYIKIKYTLATSVTDCVKADGSPIDLNLYMHVIYPTGGVEVPVLALAGSAEHLADGAATADRPQLCGAVFGGYAGVMYDHGYTPMARNDHYGYFDGNAMTGHVTGDNLTYSIQFYNAIEINTAAMRYIRYLSLSESELAFDLDAIGVYGNSKGGWMQFLGEEDPYSTPNRRLFPGHHGETRYENGDTLTVGVIDGGEEQPWLTYNGEEIDGGADLIYCSCGGTVDSITEAHAPTFITCNLSDASYYWTSNDFVNICRSMNVPSMWFEVALGHTFGYGEDMNHSVDVYEAFFDFAGYWLKGDAVSVSYIDSDISYGGMPTYAPITVKFTGSVAESELASITLLTEGVTPVDGYWTSAFGNTEWTFHPENLLSNTAYTLTVPAGIKGDNGVPSTEGKSYTFTTGYESVNSPNGVTRVTGTRGTYVSFTMPDAASVTSFNVNKYLLRINVTNDAVNKLGVYALTGFNAGSPDSATVGKCVATLPVNGRGYYEFDLTAALSGTEPGTACAFLIKEEKTAGTTRIYTADFESGISSGMSVSGSVTKAHTTLDGNGVLMLTDQALNTSYVNNTFYGAHSLPAYLACFGVMGGKSLTYDDVGRRMQVSFRVYDTTERYLGVYLNDLTSKDTGLVDYGAYNFNMKTKAGEWVTFTFEYDVYEPAVFGDAALTAKNLFFTIPCYGTEAPPIYFDDFTSTEIVTSVELAEENGAALVLSTTEQRKDPLETPYGTIPAAYEDDGTNPFVIFKKTANGYDFVTATDNIFLDSFVSSYSSINSEVVVYMRRDYTAVSRFTNLRQVLVGMTFDLGGNKLTANSASQTVYIVGNAPRVATVTDIFLNIKNGTVITDSAKAFLLIGSNTAATSADYHVTFENVKFIRPETSTNAHPIVEFTGSTNTFLTDITYTDCEFDMRGVTTTLRVFTAGNSANTARAQVTVNGGELYLSETSKVALTYALGADSSVKFSSGAGGYIKLHVPVGSAAPTYSIVGKSGANLSFVKQESSESYDTYSLISLTTPYGDIPGAYASENDYPFVIYSKNGDSYSFITGLYDPFLDSTVTNYWNVNSEIIIYMRRDYTAVSRFTNLRQVLVGITLDLGGNTLTANSASQTVYIHGNKTRVNGITSLFYNFKNGTVKASPAVRAFVLVGSNATGGTTNYSVTFDNVKFIRDTASTNAHPIVEFTNSPSIFHTDITYNDCTYDMRGLTSVLRVFTSGNAADSATSTVTVNGGELILSTSSKLVLDYALGTKSTVRFGKGENGYLTLSLPKGSAPHNPSVTSVSGYTCSYVKAETTDGKDIYHLVPKVIQGFEVKGSITLYSDFEYNVYIPTSAPVSAITLNGVKYTDLASLERAELGGVSYYVVKVRIALSAAGTPIDLAVDLVDANGSILTGTRQISVVNNLEKLLATEKGEATLTLVKDTLSYIRAAYAYAELDSAVITRIDGLIGVDYDATSTPDLTTEAKQSITGFSSACLELGDMPAYRFYLDGSYAASLYKFTVDGVSVKAEHLTDGDGKEYLKLAVYAYMMNGTVSYTVDGTEISGEFNVKAYYDYADKNESELLVSLVERLMKYSESAAAYKAEATA